MSYNVENFVVQSILFIMLGIYVRRRQPRAGKEKQNSRRNVALPKEQLIRKEDIDEYIVLQDKITKIRAQPVYQKMLRVVDNIYTEYQREYNAIIEDALDYSKYPSISNEDIVDIFISNPGPVKAFHEALTTMEAPSDLAAFTMRVLSQIDFDNDSNKFNVVVYDESWDGDFSYQFSEEDILKAAQPGYITDIMGEYKKEIEAEVLKLEKTHNDTNIHNKDDDLEMRRVARLKQQYVTENIER